MCRHRITDDRRGILADVLHMPGAARHSMHAGISKAVMRLCGECG